MKTNHLPLNLLPHYLVKSKWSTIQLNFHISENNMLRVRWHLFHKFYLFIFIFSWYWRNFDLIAIFVCCITHSFQLWR